MVRVRARDMTCCLILVSTRPLRDLKLGIGDCFAVNYGEIERGGCLLGILRGDSIGCVSTGYCLSNIYPLFDLDWFPILVGEFADRHFVIPGRQSLLRACGRFEVPLSIGLRARGGEALGGSIQRDKTEVRIRQRSS